MALLEGYGVSVAGFDGLRSDAYEKHIAARSLEELETVYSALLRPGAGYEKAQAECPGWGKGNKPPGITTLRVIKQRIMNEQAIRERVQSDGFVADEADADDRQHRQHSGKALDTPEYFESAVRTLSRELLNAKLDGKPISENLRVMDRLLRGAAIGFRKEHAGQRVELAKEALEIRKANDEIRKEKWAMEKAEMEKERVAAEAAAQPKPLKEGLESVILNESEMEILESIRTISMLEGFYGDRKDEFRQKKVRKIVDEMKALQPATSTNVTLDAKPVTGTKIKAETKAEPQSHGDTEKKTESGKRNSETNDETKGEVDDGDDETQPEADGEVEAEVDPQIAEAEAMIVSQNPDGDPVLHAANMAQTEYRYVPGYSELRDSEQLEAGEITPEEHQERKQQREWQKWYNRQNQIAREWEQEEQWFNPYA